MGSNQQHLGLVPPAPPVAVPSSVPVEDPSYPPEEPTTWSYDHSFPLFVSIYYVFWMSYVFWTTFILGLDIFHVCLVYCTLSVYIDIFFFVYFSYSILFPLFINLMIFLFLCNMWFLLFIQTPLLSGGITSSLLLSLAFGTLGTMFILVGGRVEEVICWIFG